MTKEPIVVNGKKLGRIRASWLLFKESFRFLKADAEMMLVPLVMGIVSFVLFLLFSVVYFSAVFKGAMPKTEADWDAVSDPIVYGFLFGVYVIGAFTVALSQAAITHTVHTRLKGGNSTLSGAFGVAWSHAFSLFLWAVITSTVGVILRYIAERSRLIAAILAAVLGVAWSVLTYFTVPAIVIDNHSVFPAIQRSGQVFRKTWGESLASNVSLGLIFFLAHILAFCFVIALGILSLNVLPGGAAVTVIAVLIILFIVWVFLATLMFSALDGVLRTLLYVYASDGETPVNFNKELLSQMLSRKTGSVSPHISELPTATPPVV